MNLPILGDGLHEMWDVRLVIDMFLGGAGAGAFILAVAASFSLGWERMAYLRKVAAVFAPIALAISLLLLLSELTQPGRFLLPFTSGQASSPLMWGSWIQMLFLIITAVYAVGVLGWATFSEGTDKALGVIGAALGFAVVFYHGIYLADNAARPFWALGGVTILFPIVALASGAAVLIIASALTSTKENQAPARSLTRFMVWSTLALLVGAGLYLYQLYTNGVGGQDAAHLLGAGSFATATWLGVFALGLLGLIAGYAGLRNMPVTGGEGVAASMTWPVVAALLILISAFVLRYVIVIGGQVLSQLPVT